MIKRGRDGAYWSTGSRPSHERAVPLDDVIDTTGAGDAFAAGFLSAWPGPPQAALAAGARLAAQAVAAEGGRPRRMRRMPEAVIVVAMGRHLPFADGGGRPARPRARGRASSTTSRSTARAPARGMRATRPIAARPTSAARARLWTLEGAARRSLPRDFEHYDLLLAMDRENLRELRTFAPDGDEAGKARLLREFDPHRRRARPRRPDPYYGGPDGFETVSTRSRPPARPARPRPR